MTCGPNGCGINSGNPSIALMERAAGNSSAPPSQTESSCSTGKCGMRSKGAGSSSAAFKSPCSGGKCGTSKPSGGSSSSSCSSGKCGGSSGGGEKKGFLAKVGGFFARLFGLR